MFQKNGPKPCPHELCPGCNLKQPIPFARAGERSIKNTIKSITMCENEGVPKPRVHRYEGKDGFDVLPPSVAKHVEQNSRVTQKGELDPNHFYGEYHGHPLDMLENAHVILRKQGKKKRRVAWFVGDSSLDNKYWLRDGLCKSGVNGYENVFSRKRRCMVPDIAYWFNKAAAEDEDRSAGIAGVGEWCAINTAVEESTLGDRWGEHSLLPHDRFCRDHLEAQDAIVVSAGGNDIALRPSVWSGLSMTTLMFSPMWLVQSGWAPGTSHFINLFRDGVERYLRKLVAAKKEEKREKKKSDTDAKTAGSRPSKIVVCMIYYPDEVAGGSWADNVLAFLGYNSNPGKLQSLIRRVFREATSKVSCDGVEVLAFPLFAVLDGKDRADYAQRVEPSAAGGEKMGRALYAAVTRGEVPAVEEE